jgi:hypothetical protein
LGGVSSHSGISRRRSASRERCGKRVAYRFCQRVGLGAWLIKSMKLDHCSSMLPCFGFISPVATTLESASASRNRICLGFNCNMSTAHTS